MVHLFLQIFQRIAGLAFLARFSLQKGTLHSCILVASELAKGLTFHTDGGTPESQGGWVDGVLLDWVFRKGFDGTIGLADSLCGIASSMARFPHSGSSILILRVARHGDDAVGLVPKLDQVAEGDWPFAGVEWFEEGRAAVPKSRILFHWISSLIKRRYYCN